jgi:hypothetical protein
MEIFRMRALSFAAGGLTFDMVKKPFFQGKPLRFGGGPRAPSRETLAALPLVSESTIRKALVELVAGGEVSVLRGRGLPSLYLLAPGGGNPSPFLKEVRGLLARYGVEADAEAGDVPELRITGEDDLGALLAVLRRVQ